MTEKLIPITVMLSPKEVEQLNSIAEQEKRSKSSVLRISLLAYLESLKAENTKQKCT